MSTPLDPAPQQGSLREQLEEMAISLRSGSTKGRHVTGIFDVPELVKFIDTYTASKVLEARVDSLLGWLETQEPLVVQKFLAMIVFQHIMRPTNANKFTVKVEGLTHKGEYLGDMKIAATLSAPTKEKP